MKKIFSLLTTFILIICMTVTTFAMDVTTSNGLTYKTDIYIKNGDWQKVTTLEDYISENGGYAYIYNSSGYPSLVYSTGKLEIVDNKLSSTSSISGTGMVWDNGLQGWKKSDGTDPLALNAYESGASFGTATNLWWASADVMKDGTLFMSGDENFRQPPLATVVLKVTEEELVEVAVPEMVGALKILVPCGVGLMALLVGLKLFGKQSLIFRS